VNRISIALMAAALVLVGACSPTQYIISTGSGTLITAYGKPKLDEKTGMYVYKDEEGRKATVKKDDVKQIMER
jgi:hypothetical protein